MSMHRISKRAFCDILAESESLFLGVTHKQVTDTELETAVRFATADGTDYSAARTVTKKGTTLLVFSDGSCLSVDQEGQTFWAGDDTHVLARNIGQMWVWYWLV